MTRASTGSFVYLIGVFIELATFAPVTCTNDSDILAAGCTANRDDSFVDLAKALIAFLAGAVG